MSEIIEPLSRRDAEAATSNARKMAKVIESLRKIYWTQNISTKNKKLKIKENGETIYEEVAGDKKPRENQLTPKQVEAVEIALNKPKEFEGNLTILLGKQKIYEVEDGEVKVDTLGLAPKQSKQNLQIQLDDSLEGKGRQWLEGAKKVLQTLWQPQGNGEMTFENNEYRFKVRGTHFSVVAKDGRGEVVNNNGLTKAASRDEFHLLQNMDWQSKQYHDLAYQPQQQQQQQMEPG